MNNQKDRDDSLFTRPQAVKDGTSSGLCESNHMRRIAKQLEGYHHDKATLQRDKSTTSAMEGTQLVPLDDALVGYFKWFDYNSDCLL